MHSARRDVPSEFHAPSEYDGGRRRAVLMLRHWAGVSAKAYSWSDGRTHSSSPWLLPSRRRRRESIRRASRGHQHGVEAHRQPLQRRIARQQVARGADDAPVLGVA